MGLGGGASAEERVGVGCRAFFGGIVAVVFALVFGCFGTVYDGLNVQAQSVQYRSI